MGLEPVLLNNMKHPRIIVIPLHVCGMNFKNYSYVLHAEGSPEAIVIDPAWELNKYIDCFFSHSLIPRHVLLTHTHYDHINLINEFINRYGVPVWVSDVESGRIKIQESFINTFFHGEILRLSNFISCTAYLTPGHSPGSSCFVIGSNIFTGDTLFIEGCGMCSESKANPEELYTSLGFLKKLALDKDMIYPGHRYGAYPGQTFEYVLSNNIYFHFEKKDDFVSYRMRPNQGSLFNFL
jgi:hydroxyacylglutathione hydrolase